MEGNSHYDMIPLSLFLSLMGQLDSTSLLLGT